MWWSIAFFCIRVSSLKLLFLGHFRNGGRGWRRICTNRPNPDLFSCLRRAHAVKLVNAGLAARAEPDGTPPVFRGKLGRGKTRVILHVDMDCFFVSVLVKNRPELRNKAVAVAHNGK